MLFEAGRLAVTRLGVDPVLIHCDELNGRGHGIEHSGVYAVNVCVGGIWYRLSLIGYPRASVTNYISRRALYSPVIEAISATFHALPQERLRVSHELLHPVHDFLSQEQPTVRLEHLEKVGVFYSPVSQMIDHVLSHYGVESKRDRRKPCMVADALHQAAVLTNNIHYFYDFCRHLMRDTSLQPEEPWQIAVMAVEYYRDRRTLVRSGQQPPLPGQRHQPHFNPPKLPNTIAPDKVRESVEHIGVARALAFQLYDDGKVTKAHRQACDYLEKKVMGAGKLTSQHCIGVMACGDWMPRPLLDFATIAAGTNTHERLLRLQPGLSTGKWEVHSDRLLKAISCCLGITMTQAENLTCIWGRRSPTTASGAARRRTTEIQELYFPGTFLMYNDGTNWMVVGHSSPVATELAVPRYSQATPTSHRRQTATGSRKQTPTPKVATQGPSPSDVAKTTLSVTSQISKRQKIHDITDLPRVAVSLIPFVERCLFRGRGSLNVQKNIRIDSTCITKDMKLVGRGQFSHKKAMRASFLSNDQNRIFTVDNYSCAHPLVCYTPSYVDNVHRYFPDIYSCREYALWSVLLHEMNRRYLFDVVLPTIFSTKTLDNLSTTKAPFGRQLIMKGRRNFLFAAIVKLPNKCVEFKLACMIDGKAVPKGDAVILSPPAH